VTVVGDDQPNANALQEAWTREGLYRRVSVVQRMTYFHPTEPIQMGITDDNNGARAGTPGGGREGRQRVESGYQAVRGRFHDATPNWAEQKHRPCDRQTEPGPFGRELNLEHNSK
jgi:hypothetical protein